jgi:hypothetical protein
MTDYDEVLAAYERLHGAGPEFGGDEEGNHGLTNHGPMAAEVMVRRGLDIRLDGWLDGYVKRLDVLPTPSERIDEQTWREVLGNHRRIADWTAFFRALLREQPWRELLAVWWPRLLPGISAGSTHGVIRVGHAVRTLLVTTDDRALDELANGLAFWAARWRPIPGGSGRGALSAAQALDALPALPEQTGFIAHRLTRLGDMPEWPAAATALRLPTDPDEIPAVLASLVDAATLRYLRVGRDAPVLLVHTATAPNAVLHCLPVLPRSLWRPSLAAAWAAAAAITVTYAGPLAGTYAGLPAGTDNGHTVAGEDVTAAGENVTANLLDRVAGHRDEHVIKFADTAIESFERTGDHRALAAANLAAELIAPGPG